MNEEPLAPVEIARDRVAEIPVVSAAPAEAPRAIVLWVPYFTGDAETTVPVLKKLAAAGSFAVSFDPWQHGGRGEETQDQLIERVFGTFRRGMWPILGQTTLDGLRVLEWAQERAGELPLRAGGSSMGGDVSVALAGIEPRVERVATLFSTPDWTRPGMCNELLTPPRPIDQGEADRYASWLYERLDPITHLERYRRPLSMLFECGAEDVHVPPEAALRFRDALAALEGGAEVRVELRPGAGHDADKATLAIMIDSCVDFLT